MGIQYKARKPKDITTKWFIKEKDIMSKDMVVRRTEEVVYSV
jgi:hypothetical protein